MKEKLKYPRTFHVPWSPGRGSDDKVLRDTSHFRGIRLVVTEKMDGENTTMTRNFCYARSLDSADHESQHYIKGIHARIKHQLSEDIRLHGENLFAKHSIKYNNLDDYFLVFAASDIRENIFLSFDQTAEICRDLRLYMAPTLLYNCKWSDIEHRHSFWDVMDGHEGWVVRNISEFSIPDFKLNAAKFVRENHVQTADHWKNKRIERNELRR